MGKCKVQSGNDFYDEILNNRKKLRRYMIYDICDQKKIKLPLKEKI